MVTKAQTQPFSLTPDPSLLYLTPQLQTILFKARYVIEQRQGLTVLMGDMGLGKSTLLRALHGQIAASEEFRTAFLPSPGYPSDFSLLKAICAEFSLPPRKSMLAQENELKAFLVGLYQEGKSAVVFLDEAQRLPGKQMELIRTLNNFETDKIKLVQIVLAAQMELQNKLRDPSKKAIRSRIFLPSILTTLSLPEAKEMIKFRCERSFIPVPFSDDTIKEIYDHSQGVPREILKICAAAYAMMKMSGQSQVPPEAIGSIAQEATISE